MFYAIRHLTRFRYSRPIWQSMMEVRMHPRSEVRQRCFTFRLSVNPRARIFTYQDHLGNQVHHFDLPQHHRELSIVADSLVNLDPAPELPTSLRGDSWGDLSRLISEGDHWEMLMPSQFVHGSGLLDELRRELDVDQGRGRDPLTLVQDVNHGIYRAFSYVRKSTAVNSPIEASLSSRQGVCQDFAHIMIAVVRGLRIPCRYVSGYLYHGDEHQDRSSEGATHAWVEALLPGLGWVGFDPTNNLMPGNRHIRTAVGRDYSDVPPTLGTMKGRAETELQVRVRVMPSQTLLPPDEDFVADEEWSLFLEDDTQAQEEYDQQQQQQQLPHQERQQQQ
jgi:transglutaminase-like putative cysteine protease